MNGKMVQSTAGKRPAGKKDRKNPQQRNWLAGGVAAVIALSWAVGGLILPSFAASGIDSLPDAKEQLLIDGEKPLEIDGVAEGQTGTITADESGGFVYATTSTDGRDLGVNSVNLQTDKATTLGVDGDRAYLKVSCQVHLQSTSENCWLPAKPQQASSTGGGVGSDLAVLGAILSQTTTDNAGSESAATNSGDGGQGVTGAPQPAPAAKSPKQDGSSPAKTVGNAPTENAGATTPAGDESTADGSAKKTSAPTATSTASTEAGEANNEGQGETATTDDSDGAKVPETDTEKEDELKATQNQERAGARPMAVSEIFDFQTNTLTAAGVATSLEQLVKDYVWVQLPPEDGQKGYLGSGKAGLESPLYYESGKGWKIPSKYDDGVKRRDPITAAIQRIKFGNNAPLATFCAEPDTTIKYSEETAKKYLPYIKYSAGNGATKDDIPSGKLKEIEAAAWLAHKELTGVTDKGPRKKLIRMWQAVIWSYSSTTYYQAHLETCEHSKTNKKNQGKCETAEELAAKKKQVKDEIAKRAGTTQEQLAKLKIVQKHAQREGESVYYGVKLDGYSGLSEGVADELTLKFSWANGADQIAKITDANGNGSYSIDSLSAQQLANGIRVYLKGNECPAAGNEPKLVFDGTAKIYGVIWHSKGQQTQVSIDPVTVKIKGGITFSCTITPQTEPTPEVVTVAHATVGDKTGLKHVKVGDKATLQDDVKLINLKLGKDYQLSATLWKKMKGQANAIEVSSWPAQSVGDEYKSESGTETKKWDNAFKKEVTVGKDVEKYFYTETLTYTDANGKQIIEHGTEEVPAENQDITVTEDDTPPGAKLKIRKDVAKETPSNLAGTITFTVTCGKSGVYTVTAPAKGGEATLADGGTELPVKPGETCTVAEAFTGNSDYTMTNIGWSGTYYAVSFDEAEPPNPGAWTKQPPVQAERPDYYDNPNDIWKTVLNTTDRLSADQLSAIGYFYKTSEWNDAINRVRPLLKQAEAQKLANSAVTKLKAYRDQVNAGGYAELKADYDQRKNKHDEDVKKHKEWEDRKKNAVDPGEPKNLTFTEGNTPGSTQVEFEVPEGSASVALAAKNSYKKQVGKVTIRKVVSTSDVTGLPAEYAFNVKCAKDGATVGGDFNLANGASQTIENVPFGANCTVVETVGDVPAGYNHTLTWKVNNQPASASPKNTISFDFTGTPAEVTVEADNAYVAKDAAFSLKKIANWADGTLIDNVTFPVTYRCVNPGQSTAIKDSVDLIGNGATVTVPESKGIKAGATCTVTEDAPGTKVTDATLKTAVLDVENATKNSSDTGTIEFTLPTSGDATVTVTATNTYNRKVGHLTIEKKLSADTDAAKYGDKKFPFTVACEGYPEEKPFISQNDGKWPSQDYPFGTKCTVTENISDVDQTKLEVTNLALTAGAGFTTGEADGNKFVTGTITGSDDNATISVVATNKVAPKYGKISVEKVTDGYTDKTTSKKIDFAFYCGEGRDAAAKSDSEPTFTLQTGLNGTATKDQLTPGTKCLVREKNADIKGYTHSVQWEGLDENGEVTVPAQDGTQVKTVTVKATNTYTKKMGKFSIAKKVKSKIEDITLPTHFTFKYSCTSDLGNQAEENISIEAGAAAKVYEVPADSKCSVEETNVPKVDGTTVSSSIEARGATDAKVEGKKVSFTVPESATPKVEIEVEATNKYVTENVGFQVTKEIRGDRKGLITDKKFNFSWSCTLGQRTRAGKGSLTYDGVNGTSIYEVKDDQILSGSTCRIWETKAGKTVMPNVAWTMSWREENGVTVPKDSSGKPNDLVDGFPVATFKVESGAPVLLTAVNNYNSEKGGFVLTKKAVNNGPDKETPKGAIAEINGIYKFQVTCGGKVVTPAGGAEIKANAKVDDEKGKFKMDNIAVGTECTVEELEATAPPGHTLSTEYTVDGKPADTATFTVNTKGTEVKVVATNTYTRDHGTFSVTKKVTNVTQGEFATYPENGYKFSYTCTRPTDQAELEDPITGEIIVQDGTTVTSGNIPVGWTCTLTEDALDRPDILEEGQNPKDKPEAKVKLSKNISPASVVIGSGTSKQEFEAINTYSDTLGKFKVVKQIAENADTLGVSPTSFDFTYTCSYKNGPVVKSGEFTLDLTKPEAGEDELGISGKKTFISEEMPTGTECTVTEQPGESPAVKGAKRTVSWTYTATDGSMTEKTLKGSDSFTQVVIGPKDTVRTLTATNDYSRENLKLQFTKTVEGLSGELKPASVNLHWACTLGNKTQQGTVQVTTDENPNKDVLDSQQAEIPYGANCEVYEVAAGTEVAGYTPALTMSVTPAGLAEALTDVVPGEANKLKFIANTDAEVTVAAVNKYTVNPKIGTTLTGNDGQAKVVEIGKDAKTALPETITLLDKIDYENVKDGRYRFVGYLTDKATGDVISGTLKVSDPVTLNGSGSFELPLTVARSEVYAHPELTAYEFLAKADEVNTKTGELIGEAKWVAAHAPGHEGWVEEGTQAEGQTSSRVNQSVTIKVAPKLGTEAKSKDSGTREIPAGEAATIVDTVDYQHLAAGDYKLYGVLVDKDSGKTVAGPVTKTVTSAAYQDTKQTWTDVMEFSLSAEQVEAGKSYVVMEYLFPTTTNTEAEGFNPETDESLIAKHADKGATKQTVKTPTLETNATIGKEDGPKQADLTKGGAEVTGTVKVVDKVTYSDLQVDKEYTVTGELHFKNADGTDGGVVTLANGQTTVSKPITPTADNSTIDEKTGLASGSVNLEFEVNASDLYGKVAVAFEKLERDGKTVAAHKNIKDKDQTVYFPKLETKAQGKDETQVVAEGEGAQVTDTITYSGLNPEESYVFVAKLLDTAKIGQTSADAVATGSAVLSAAANEGKGEIKVSLSSFTAEKGKTYVVYEEAYLAGDVTVASDRTVTVKDGKQPVGTHKDATEEKQQVRTAPELKTNATVAPGTEDGKYAKPATPEQNVTVTDKVTYTNLVVGKDYTVSGELHVKNADGTDGGVLMNGDAPVTASKTFKPTEADGFVELTFTFPANLLAGKAAVAFEKLERDGKTVGTHTDITDKAQTVYFADMKTTATDKADGDKFLAAGKDATVVDTVTFTGNLKPETTYVVSGKLMDKSTNTEVTGAKVSQIGKFTTDKAGRAPVLVEAAEGQPEVRGVKVEFTVPAAKVTANSSFVVFESLYEGEEATGTPVIVHEEIEDPDQTVTVPSLTTTAEDKTDGDKNIDNTKPVTVVDVVEYDGLDPEKVYTLEGELMINDGSENGVTTGITATTTIGKDQGEGRTIPASGKGSVKLEFTITDEAVLASLAGKWVVAFETLKQDGNTVSIHHDIKDKAQTVYVPKIGTTARDGSSTEDAPSHVTEIELDKDGNPTSGATIIDHVTWEAIAPGDYTVVGTLVDRANGEVIKGLDPVAQSLNVPAKKGDVDTPRIGYLDMTFTLTKEQIKDLGLVGKDLVVFEKLYKATDAPVVKNGTVENVPAEDKVVAAHADKGDDDQTVSFKGKSLTTNAKDQADGDKFVDNTKPVTIVDVVTYTGLEAGKLYTLEGELMDKATGEGTGIKNSIKIGTEGTEEIDKAITVPNGSVELEFTVDANLILGKTVVAFETLKKDGKEFLIHHDIEDDAQTIEARKIGTVAKGTEDKTIVASEDSIITDTVDYEGLVVGTKYVVAGELMKKVANLDDQGQPVLDEEGQATYKAEATGIFAAKEFTAKESTGSVDVKFAVPANTFQAGETTVVFEKLYLEKDVNVKKTGGKDDEADSGTVTPKTSGEGSDKPFQPIASHEDPTDEAQIVVVKSAPSIGTVLFDNPKTIERTENEVAEIPLNTASLLDKVSYEGLTVTKKVKVEGQDKLVDQKVEYQLNAELMLVAADGTYQSVGSGEQKFYPEATGTGEVYVPIKFGKYTPKDGEPKVDYAPNPGDKLVAFETLYRLDKPGKEDGEPGEKVTDHKNPDDKNQTVIVKYQPKELATSLTETGKNTKVFALGDESIKLTDVVTYEGLTRGTEYVLAAELMKKVPNLDDQGQPVLDDKGQATYKAEATGIKGYAKFTPETSGKATQDVTFEISSADLKKLIGTGDANELNLVAYEYLFKASDVDVNEGTKVVTPKGGKTLEDADAKHTDIKDEAQTITVTNTEKIGTTLTTDGSKAKSDTNQIAHVTDRVELIDTIDYYNLKPNREYTLTGVLMGGDGVTTEEVEGKTVPKLTATSVVAKTKFTTPAAPAGKTLVSTTDKGVKKPTVTFEVPLEVLSANRVLVAYEKLYLGDKTNTTITDSDKPVATHEDPNDENQTVKVPAPSVGTIAKVKESGKSTVTIVNSDTDKSRVTIQTGNGLDTPENITIVDTVKYNGLQAGKDYALVGKLVEKVTTKTTGEDGQVVTTVSEKAFQPDGADITSSVVFTAAAGENNTVAMEFTVPTSALREGLELVVYERLYAPGTFTEVKESKKVVDDTPNDADKFIAKHEEIGSEAQTVVVGQPKFGSFTLAKQVENLSDKEVADTFEYKFHWSCKDANGNVLPNFGDITLTKGQTSALVTGLPDNAVCTIEEDLDHVAKGTGLADTVSWTGNIRKPMTNGEMTFQIGEKSKEGEDRVFDYAFTAKNTLEGNPTLGTSTVSAQGKDVVSGMKFIDNVNYTNLPQGTYVLHTYFVKKTAGNLAPQRLTDVPSQLTQWTVGAGQTAKGTWPVEITVPEELGDHQNIIVWEDLYRLGDFDIVREGDQPDGKIVGGQPKEGKKPIVSHHENKLPGERDATQWVNYVDNYGGFKITKVKDVAAGVTKSITNEFTFTYNCVIEAGKTVKPGTKPSGELKVTVDAVTKQATTEAVTGLPVDTKCTIHEQPVAGLEDDGVKMETRWGQTKDVNTPAWTDGTASASYELTVQATDSLTVTAINKFTPAPASLGTTATVEGGDENGKVVPTGSDAVITDVVTYKGLKANTSYLLKGRLVLRDNAGNEVANGQVGEEISKIVTTNATGTVADVAQDAWKLDLPVTAAQIESATNAKQAFVVFEKLYAIEVDAQGKPVAVGGAVTDDVTKVQIIGDSPVATHEEIGDAGQTVRTKTAPSTTPSTTPATTPGTTPATTPGTTPATTPNTTPPATTTPPVRGETTRPPSQPPVRGVETTPPTKPATTIPPSPPVLPAMTLPPKQPKLPPVLAHTGAQATVVGILALLMIGAGAGIGFLARRRRDSEEA